MSKVKIRKLKIYKNRKELSYHIFKKRINKLKASKKIKVEFSLPESLKHIENEGIVNLCKESLESKMFYETYGFDLPETLKFGNSLPNLEFIENEDKLVREFLDSHISLKEK